MKSSAGIIHLLDRANKQLKLVAQQGLPPDFIAQIENVPSDRGLGKRLIEAGDPLFVTDITSDSRMAEVAYTGSPQVYVGLPIRAQGRVVGVLSIIRQVDQPQYNVEEVTLLRSIADQVGVVVQSARLRERVEQAAIIEERTRLARDLHDSVTQSLYGATLFADAGKELIKANDLARASEYMSRTGEVIQTALKEMRLLIYELRPAMLEQVGLVGALRQRLETVERRANISVGLTAGESINLPMTVEQELYHIAQEALNNALKHAEATSVTVSLTGNETQVFLEVSDNGRGFDYETARQQGGLGLITMRERAEKIDGKLEIATAPDKGTQVKVIVASDLSASRLNGE
jgi:signal transduction histidine kinase